MKNKTLWLMVGAPGSGKSTFAKEELMRDETWAYISRDEIRYEYLEPDDDNFAKEDIVFNQFVTEINDALESNEFHDVIADATHLHEPSRMKLLCRLNLNGIDVIPVVMRTLSIICEQRNKLRQGRAQVPEKALNSMWKAMTHPSNDAFDYKAIMEVFT